MIAPALQHRILALANQVGPRADLEGAPASLHRYKVRKSETVRDDLCAAPVLELVLEGRKTIWRDGNREIFRAGQLLLLPVGLPLDVTNEPCAESGVYRAMRLEFAPDAIARFRANWPEAPERLPGEAPLRVAVDGPLVESLGHALEALLQPEHHGRLTAMNRLMEVLLRLRRQGKLADLVGEVAETEPVAALPRRAAAAAATWAAAPLP